MNIKTYESLSEFFAQDKIDECLGDYVQTLGFDTAGDGGAAMFKVISATANPVLTQLEIEGRIFKNRYFTLELIPENNTVYIEQFGAKGNVDFVSMTDEEKAALAAANKLAIDNAIFAAPVVVFSPKTYYTAGTISVYSYVRILGNNAQLYLYSPEEGDTLIKIDTDTHGTYESVEISDMFFCGAIDENDFLEEKRLVEIDNSDNVRFENVHFSSAEYAVYAVATNGAIDNILFSNCIIENICNGLYFKDATNVKIRNLRIDHANTEIYPDAVSGFGLKLEGNCFGANVEDLSVFNTPSNAVEITKGVWDNDATNSIFFKNLLVDGAKEYAIVTKENDVPVRFANAMIVNALWGLLSFRTKNLSFVNSSIQVANGDNGLIATPLTFASNTNAKFTKVQFEFPDMFMNTDASTVALEANELTFVDCTLQKTDMYVEPVAGVGGVNSTGFGAFGYNGPRDNPFIITFDACEFRSYQRDFCTLDENGAMVAYNPPITLRARPNTNSKLIIKNCRFVNDAPCNAPYFMLDDTRIYGNVVVYNCFFENYTYSETADGVETFPLFAKVTNGIAVADTTNHNVFARCNMRSSTPIRSEGTTINETKEYQ